MMIRVCIVCEGGTEVRFVKQCLSDHFRDRKIEVYARNLCGNVSVARLVDHVRKEYHNCDRITTLVDFYGFKDRNDRDRSQLENAIQEDVGRKTSSFDARFFLPYVQMHEFEALLFADIEQFRWVLDGWNIQTREALLSIKNTYPCPEDINDSSLTAPSRRLEKIFGKRYSKIEHGPIIAEKIGLAAIRRQCPAFDEWLGKLESWGR